MMGFIDVKNVKLGNMRKAVDWTLSPSVEGRNATVMQCDKRIVAFDLETGKGKLSSGKGGHPGFWTLQQPDAIEVVVPQEVLEQIRAKLESRPDYATGVIRIL